MRPFQTLSHTLRCIVQGWVIVKVGVEFFSQYSVNWEGHKSGTGKLSKVSERMERCIYRKE